MLLKRRIVSSCTHDLQSSMRLPSALLSKASLRVTCNVLPIMMPSKAAGKENSAAYLISTVVYETSPLADCQGCYEVKEQTGLPIM